jgi:choice-of-anchor A domain-containing protein
LFNVPNATSIQVNGVMWGSLLAPRAAVTTTNVQVRGNVIARSYTQNGDVLDWSRRFLGTFPW